MPSQKLILNTHSSFIHEHNSSRYKSYSLFIEWNTMKQLKPMNYQYLQNTVYWVKKLGMKEYILYYSIYIKLSEWQIQSTMEECRSVVVWVREADW